MFDYNGFGALGGCYIVGPNGMSVIEDDGLIASNFNSFGGEAVIDDNNGFLIPETERYGFNLLNDFDISDTVNLFYEGKYFRQETNFGTNQNSFYDLLTIAPDNPLYPGRVATNCRRRRRVVRDPRSDRSWTKY